MSKLSRKPKTADEFIEAANGATKEMTTESPEGSVPKKREYTKRYPWKIQRYGKRSSKGTTSGFPNPIY